MVRILTVIILLFQFSCTYKEVVEPEEYVFEGELKENVVELIDYEVYKISSTDFYTIKINFKTDFSYLPDSSKVQNIVMYNNNGIYNLENPFKTVSLDKDFISVTYLESGIYSYKFGLEFIDKSFIAQEESFIIEI